MIICLFLIKNKTQTQLIFKAFPEVNTNICVLSGEYDGEIGRICSDFAIYSIYRVTGIVTIRNLNIISCKLN